MIVAIKDTGPSLPNLSEAVREQQSMVQKNMHDYTTYSYDWPDTVTGRPRRAVSR
jgi:hypothetical protein